MTKIWNYKKKKKLGKNLLDTDVILMAFYPIILTFCHNFDICHNDDFYSIIHNNNNDIIALTFYLVIKNYIIISMS